jgi:predicted nucleic acid-binding protein
MTVLIDSWAWIEYWKGGAYSRLASEHIDGSETAIVSTVNLAEIYYWVLKHYNTDVAKQKKTTITRRCFLIPLDESIAVNAAKAKKEHGIGLADSIVLATGQAENAQIVTGDPDFKELANVIYIGR